MSAIYKGGFSMTSALSLSTMAYAKLDEEIYAFLLTWPPPNLAPFYPCTPTSHTQTYSPAPPWLQHWPCPRWLLCQTGWWNLCLPVKMTPQPCPLPFSPLPPHTNTYSLAPPWLQPWPCPPWLYVKLGEEIYAFLLKWHPNPALSPFPPFHLTQILTLLLLHDFSVDLIHHGLDVMLGEEIYAFLLTWII